MTETSKLSLNLTNMQLSTESN